MPRKAISGNIYVIRNEWDKHPGRMVERDDHRAMPVFEEAWDATLDKEMEDRLSGGGFKN